VPSSSSSPPPPSPSPGPSSRRTDSLALVSAEAGLLAASLMRPAKSMARLPLSPRRLALLVLALGVAALLLLSPTRRYVEDRGRAAWVAANERVQDLDMQRLAIPEIHWGSAWRGGAAGDVLANVRAPPAPHADPLRTTRCADNGGRFTDARGNPRPVVQYGVMIDAGSTGSRVHVYKVGSRELATGAGRALPAARLLGWHC
jgi:guanosine-diphosphatase